ncbi:ABC-F family ATP-binding cassette domain-containing protein [Paenibacillus macerans]|uniref:ABC-F family ATP-binding cassette domain-containing protein n=1 Tax=Paenibacillus macerans TaxID=44252 RepID=UPI001B19D01F|nr:ABC-F family ATP-binding cassette domain-containing protein [Paenibacillus macerans]MEC0138557.1 ABC-F family ATP-binding cassette domain-containing protein [Paenibacillus macerans]GIP12146.1 multidrug ABC transporter ATP-binding protein [Paenibacillus macerans]
MNILTVEHITKTYGEKVLFQDVSFGMEENDKIGVIGVNGTGKSTFLRVIAGLEAADDGRIAVNRDVRVNFLAQNPQYDPEISALRGVFQGGGPELQVVSAYMEAEEALEQSPEDAARQAELTRLAQEMDRLQAWTLVSDAKSVLSKLGIGDFGQKMGTLSGGQRKRVALASALIVPSELLIMDEPTNHIDNDSVAWLETYLQKRRGALLLITHDRYFLDRVCNVMLELDHGRLFRYEANYSRFLELKSEREEREAASEQKRQNLLRTELAWIRRGAKARSTKQKARIERFEQLQTAKTEYKSDALDISVASTRLGRKIVEIHGIRKSSGDRLLIGDLTYTAVPGDRVGIVGPNGSGKSTLLNMIAGRIEPDQGEIVIGQTVKLGYFTQEHQEMDGKQRVIEYIKEAAEVVATADGTRITAAQMLERFLFPPDMQWTPISKLSGGEKRRLYLLRVLMGAPNVLLLDEPTNDLDIQTLTVLEAYLDEFPGAVFVVSHDRYFLDRTVDKIMAFEGGGVVAVHVGDYSDYEERLRASGGGLSKTAAGGGPGKPGSGAGAGKPAAGGAKASAGSGSSDPSGSGTGHSDAAAGADASNYRGASRGDKLKFSYNEQREFETIEATIEAAEQRLADIAGEMEAAASDAARLQELMKQQEEAEAELERLMERWTYLNELAEKIAAQRNS